MLVCTVSGSHSLADAYAAALAGAAEAPGAASAGGGGDLASIMAARRRQVSAEMYVSARWSEVAMSQNHDNADCCLLFRIPGGRLNRR